MQWVLARLSDRRSRWWLAGALVALVAALVVGISDNLVGVALAGLACFGAVAALTTGWSRPRPFLVLAGAALLGFPVFVVLHNTLYALGVVTAGIPVVPAVADVLGAAAFIVAVLVCPAAFVVGAAGALATWVRTRQHAPA